MTKLEIETIKYEDLLIIEKLVIYFDDMGYVWPMWDQKEWLAFEKDSNKPFNGIAQKVKDEGIERYTFEDGIITESYYHNKNVHTRYKYKHDGGVDYVDEFYKTGELKTRTKRKDGIYKEFFSTHFRLPETPMLHQERCAHDVSREEFYKTGELKSTANYDGMDYLHGPFKTYFKSGELCIKKNYNHHRIHGPCDYFYKNGLLKKSHIFNEGQKDGAQLFYDTQGNLERTEIWENGKMKSLKDGRLKKTENYKNGQKDGLFENFEKKRTEEEKNQIAKYKKQELEAQDMELQAYRGIEDGVIQTFYDNGKLKTRTSYKDGKLFERFDSLYEDGQLKKTENYKNGQKDGLFEYFDESGKCTTRIRFKNGSKAAKD